MIYQYWQYRAYHINNIRSIFYNIQHIWYLQFWYNVCDIIGLDIVIDDVKNNTCSLFVIVQSFLCRFWLWRVSIDQGCDNWQIPIYLECHSKFEVLICNRPYLFFVDTTYIIDRTCSMMMISGTMNHWLVPISEIINPIVDILSRKSIYMEHDVLQYPYHNKGQCKIKCGNYLLI